MLGCLAMFVCMYFVIIFYLKNQSVEKVITLIIIHEGEGGVFGIDCPDRSNITTMFSVCFMFEIWVKVGRKC